MRRYSLLIPVIMLAALACGNPHLDIALPQRAETHVNVYRDIQQEGYDSLRLHYLYQDRLPEDPAVFWTLRDLVLSLHDAFTRYYNKEDFTAYKQRLDENSAKTGVTLGRTNMEADLISQTNQVYIKNVEPGSEAEWQGIEVGGIVTAIDGESLNNLTFAEARDLLPNLNAEVVDIEITYYGEKMVVDTTRLAAWNVKSFMLDSTVGYISLRKFHKDAFVEVYQAINDMHYDSMMDYLILDLRNNTGGFTMEGIHLADFLQSEPGNVLLQRRYKDRVLRPESSHITADDLAGFVPPRSADFDHDNADRLQHATFLGPDNFVVFTDKLTASTSEVLINALKSYNRAYLIGSHTYGKALGMELVELTDGSGMTITAYDLYPPFSTTSVHGVGVDPDQYLMDHGADESAIFDSAYKHFGL